LSLPLPFIWPFPQQELQLMPLPQLFPFLLCQVQLFLWLLKLEQLSQLILLWLLGLPSLKLLLLQALLFPVILS